MAARNRTATTFQNALTVTSLQVATFDRLKNQLRQLYEEISTLSKKSPDGAVNKFKLGFVNEKLTEANELLGNEAKPSPKFTVFDADTIPTNSDVVLMLAQYLDALESWRSARIHFDEFRHYWNTSDGRKIETEGATRYTES